MFSKCNADTKCPPNYNNSKLFCKKQNVWWKNSARGMYFENSVLHVEIVSSSLNIFFCRFLFDSFLCLSLFFGFFYSTVRILTVMTFSCLAWARPTKLPCKSPKKQVHCRQHDWRRHPFSLAFEKDHWDTRVLFSLL